MPLRIQFDNSYARLDERFFTRIAPTPVSSPELIAANEDLAFELGIDLKDLSEPEALDSLAGNSVPDGAEPIAQVYAGHQFGGWSPRLGDGRALLLGEVVTSDQRHFDIQLKGSGPTPYSRNGDGRAWLGPVLREYVVSEAMNAVGVPTTRALAAVRTGDRVQRETALPGAILTRVAASHIRVGTFQYFAARKDTEALEALSRYCIQRHYPDANNALDLLNFVVKNQANLVARWMGVGFIHGVMNTDNMTISGETIDYGPCAFMDTYNPMQVFSSIDRQGRYAFARQPDVAMWNLAQLATSLLPIIGEVEPAQAAIDLFPEIFRVAWLREYRLKLGLRSEEDTDVDLVHSLLDRMANGNADFTNTFRSLGTTSARDNFMDPTSYDEWEIEWKARLDRENTALEECRTLMMNKNPAVIPRNHRIEQAIQAAVEGNDEAFHRLNRVLKTPFTLAPEDADLARAPYPDEVVSQTFCGT